MNQIIYVVTFIALLAAGSTYITPSTIVPSTDIVESPCSFKEPKINLNNLFWDPFSDELFNCTSTFNTCQLTAHSKYDMRSQYVIYVAVDSIIFVESNYRIKDKYLANDTENPIPQLIYKDKVLGKFVQVDEYWYEFAPN